MGPIAAGGLIRNGSGDWFSDFISFLDNGCSLLAELWAILLGLQLARSKDLHFIIIESDCKIAVDLVNSHLFDSHHFAPIIHSIISELARFQQFKVQHVLREANTCADGLAKYALEKRSPFAVFYCVPSFISTVYFADCCGVALPRIVPFVVGID